MGDNEQYDLCVIGGGINGTGIARDAAGRGLKVLLVEQNDLAGGTSSSSTKLIHGGLRYLEYYEFAMVREALQEREALLTIAPHLIHPLAFVLPHDGTRPAWMIRAGLFLYDHLAQRRSLPSSKALNLHRDKTGTPLANPPRTGFQYADCQTDDARLTILNALDAHERGAAIKTDTACIGLSAQNGVWTIELQDKKGIRHTVRASMLINATGPWVNTITKMAGSDPDQTPRAHLVKGSHIITRRLYDGDQAYILQQPDKRVVFAIPYEDEFTLIGTTEEEFSGDPAEAAISDKEKTYLCQSFNRSFKQQISDADIIYSYSGIRPLFADKSQNATAASRDYKLHHHTDLAAPMLSIYGGKLTTYRAVAEEAVSEIMTMAGYPAKPAWTAQASLPGGDFNNFPDFVTKQQTRYPWLPAKTLKRYARSYGTRMDVFLKDKTSLDDMGHHYGADLYEAELDYLKTHEWARTGENTEDDILWRRTKLKLQGVKLEP